MFIIESQSTVPNFNLAAEEYLFRQQESDFCFIYRNSPAVVCGKHQIPYKEINLRYVLAHKIDICRRFSGGGTVYHDLGNINICFIHTPAKTIDISSDFTLFLQAVHEFLSALGLHVTRNDRNALLLQDRKISGAAQHISKNRILHHGTLLYNANLSDLKQAVCQQKDKYTDKSVESVPSKVCNIIDYLPVKISVSDFVTQLSIFLKNYFSCTKICFSELQEHEILELSEKKYQTKEWLYEYSPDYSFLNSIAIENDLLPFSLAVCRGEIVSVNIPDNHINSDLPKFLKSLIGKKHQIEDIKAHFQSNFSEKNNLHKIEENIVLSLF